MGKHLPNIILVIALLMGAPTAFAQASAPIDPYGRWLNGVSEPWWLPESISRDDTNQVQIRWSAIENENTTSRAEEWTGNYFSGSETHGSYLRWSKQSGFVLVHVDKCAAQVMSFSYGRVVSSADFIQLLPENAASARQNHGHLMQAATRFLPVSWRGNFYLVPEDEIADFGDYVAGLGKYNEWAGNYIEIAEFFTRFGKEVSSVETTSIDKSEPNNLLKDRPVVPPGYERFIKKPIDALITTVGKSYVKRDSEDESWDDLLTPVSINVGSAKGLRVKMSLRVVSSREFGNDDEFVEVTQVSLHSAKGVIKRPVRKRPCVKFDPADDCKDPDYQTIKTGWRITTVPLK